MGQTLFVSTSFLDVYIEKKTKSDILKNNLYSNSSVIVPLTKIQVAIPYSNLKKDGIITIKVVQWNCDLSRTSRIVFTPIIELKSGGEKIKEFTNSNLIYLGKIANYDALKGRNDIYKCQVYDETIGKYFDVIYFHFKLLYINPYDYFFCFRVINAILWMKVVSMFCVIAAVWGSFQWASIQLISRLRI